MTKPLQILTLAFAALFAFQMSAFAQVPTEDQEQEYDADAYEAEGNILNVLEQHEELSEFAQALRQTGLDQELEGEGPFTVFAPNNEAFEKIKNGVERDRDYDADRPRDEEQDPDPMQQEGQEGQDQDRQDRPDRDRDEVTDEDLAEVLRNHIVMGEMHVADLQPGTELQTMAGNTITVQERGAAYNGVMDDEEEYEPREDDPQDHEPQQQERQERDRDATAHHDVQIENANIIQSDIQAENGVIHTIDSVLELVEEEPVPVGGE